MMATFQGYAIVRSLRLWVMGLGIAGIGISICIATEMNGDRIIEWQLK